MVLHKTIDGIVGCSDWDDLATTFLGEGRQRYTCSYLIFDDGTDAYAQNGTTGAIDYGGPADNGATDGADDQAVIQAALNGLTAARTWKEKVIIKGDFTIDSSLFVPSYTVIEVQGSITLGAGVAADSAIFWNSDIVGGNSEIEIFGGILDGNTANQVNECDPIRMRNISNSSFHHLKIINARNNAIRIRESSYVLVESLDIDTTTLNSGVNYLDVDHGLIVDCRINNTEQAGVAFEDDPLSSLSCTYCLVANTVVSNTNLHGIDFEHADYCGAIGCIVDTVAAASAHYDFHSGGTGNFIIGCQGRGTGNRSVWTSDTADNDDLLIMGCTFRDSTNQSILHERGARSMIIGNDCDDLIQVYVAAGTAVGGVISENRAAGIWAYKEEMTVSSNLILDSTFAGGIRVEADDCVVEGNIVARGNRHGIWVTSADNVIVHGNICKNCDQDEVNNDGIHLEDATHCIVTENQCFDDQGGAATQNYGIAESGTSDYNVIQRNRFSGNVIAAVAIIGANTVLSTLKLQFVDGTIFLNAAPFGWEIDADTEYAIALGHLPLEVQQVVRWKIWATSLVAEADAMRLEINGYGGADNEAYNTETVAVANHPSESSNFAVNDVIYWVLDSSDDVDLDDMLGNDQIMIQVLHEVAGGPDCATDAAFTCAEIEYV